MARRKIGILGGSFNPAHEGHLQIGLSALTQLGLDAIWWIVSPQNPLKSKKDMAPFSARIASIASLIRNHPKMRIMDIECRIGTSYTAQTLTYLQKRFRDCDFVWLMGADNMVQIHSWKEWQSIFNRVPIAVFDRPGYTYPALKARAASYFAANRKPEVASHLLVHQAPPAWIFMHDRLNPLSASAIRAKRSGNKATGGLPMPPKEGGVPHSSKKNCGPA